MGAFFVYILKSSVCLAVFYLFYRCLLSRETFHRFNRFALLGVMVLSLTVPYYKVKTELPVEVHQTIAGLEKTFTPQTTVQLSSRIATAEIPQDSGSFPWSWQKIALAIYVAGILLFLIRNIYSLARMAFLLRKSKRKKLGNGITLVIHDSNLAPFSWVKYIVVSAADMQEGGEEIITHEREHIRHSHSFDLLLAEITVLFQWFNPAAWLFKQELQNIHEYEADEAVLNHGIDAKQYQLLLIKKAVGSVRFNSLANSFNHSTLKKRITMMLKRKSNPWARLKYLCILPLAAIVIAVFARQEISGQLDRISALKVNDFKLKPETIIKKVEPVTAEQAKLAESRKDLVQVSDSAGFRNLSLNKVFVPGKRYYITVDGFSASFEDIMKISPSEIAEIILMNPDSKAFAYNDAKDGWFTVSTRKAEQRRSEAIDDLNLSGNVTYKTLASCNFEKVRSNRERIDNFLSSANVDLSAVRIVIDGEPGSEKTFRNLREVILSGMQLVTDEKGEKKLFVRTCHGDSFRKFKAGTKNPLVILKGEEVAVSKLKPSELYNTMYEMYGCDKSETFGPKAKGGALFIDVKSEDYWTDEWKGIVRTYYSDSAKR